MFVFGQYLNEKREKINIEGLQAQFVSQAKSVEDEIQCEISDVADSNEAKSFEMLVNEDQSPQENQKVCENVKNNESLETEKDERFQ